MVAVAVAGFIAVLALTGPGLTPVLAADRTVVGTADAAGSAIVLGVIDGDTIRLDRSLHGSAIVRLAGIRAPKAAEPLAAEARRALAALVDGRPLDLRFPGAVHDRHRRLVADLFGDTGEWVQKVLVRDGWARVDPVAGQRERTHALLRLEHEARTARRGLWDHPAYAVRTPVTVAGHLHSYQIVEGPVVEAVAIGRRINLNFGEDYRTDFTVTIAPEDRKAFAAEGGFDPLALAGQRVRVRGWVQVYRGPQIAVADPDQIERLDP